MFIYATSSWTLELDKDDYNDLEINSIINFESSITTINLFGKIYDLPETKIYVSEAMVEKITINSNKKTILISAKSIEIHPFNNN